MFRTRLDLPLASDPTGRFLAWIIALMVFLAVLVLAGAMVLAGMAGRWSSGLSGTVTVQVAPLPNAAPLPKRVEAAVALLRNTPGVVGARPVTAEETAHLLEPWLGNDIPTADLPLPALIDVTVSGPMDMRALGQRLASAVPGASLDDHGAWMSDLLRLAGTVQAVALGVVALVGGAGVAAVVFAVRTGLAIHRHVVELLHVIGAPDRYVARQFEIHVLALAARGGAIGLGCALMSLAAIHWAAGDLQAGMLPGLTLSPVQWIGLAAVPLAASLLATLTARWTVLRALAEMP